MDENPVQSLGFISRLKNRLSQVNQRTVFDAFIVLLILIGLAASVYLAGQRQIFRSRAAQEGNAIVVDQDGKEIEQKEGDATVVETQQIRLKIDFPTEWNTQGFVPSSLFSPAYAAEAPQCLNQNETRCQGTTCINANYYEGSTFVRDGYEAGCYQCTPSCSSGATTPTSTPTPTQPPAQQSCPGQCASPINQSSAVTINGSTCTSYLGNSAYDTNCRSKNTGYDWCYTSCAQAPTATPIPTRPPAQAPGCGTPWEGKRTQCSADAKLDQAGCIYLDAWSRPKKTVCSESTPFCWACPESAFDPPAQPTAPPPQTITQPPQGAAQPPTATPVPEQTQWIRISLNENNVKSGNCFREPRGPGTGSSNPREHCMEFSITDPYFTQRGNLVDVWLPNQPRTYTIYIGFVSNKGNFKSAPPVKVTYRPKQTTRVQPTQPQPTPRTVSTCDKLFDDCMRTVGIEEGATEAYCNKIKGACELPKTGDADRGFTALGGTPPIPTPQPAAQPTPQAVDEEGKPIVNRGLCPGAPRSCVSSLTLNKNGETCRGDEWSTLYTGCPEQFPICIAKNAHCSEANAPPPTPTPIPLEETPSLLQRYVLYIQNTKSSTIRLLSALHRGGFPFYSDQALSFTPIRLQFGEHATLRGQPPLQSECGIFAKSLTIIVTYYDFGDSKQKTAKGEYICNQYGIITIR